MRKSIVAVLAAMSFAGMIASPAAAAEDVSVVVSYADLNLAAPAGTVTLEKRIEAATEKVCERPSLRDLKAMSEWESCKAAARAGALEQLSILEPYESLALASVF